MGQMDALPSSAVSLVVNGRARAATIASESLGIGLLLT